MQFKGICPRSAHAALFDRLTRGLLNECLACPTLLCNTALGERTNAFRNTRQFRFYVVGASPRLREQQRNAKVQPVPARYAKQNSDQADRAYQSLLKRGGLLRLRKNGGEARSLQYSAATVKIRILSQL